MDAELRLFKDDENRWRLSWCKQEPRYHYRVITAPPGSRIPNIIIGEAPSLMYRDTKDGNWVEDSIGQESETECSKLLAKGTIQPQECLLLFSSWKKSFFLHMRSKCTFIEDSGDWIINGRRVSKRHVLTLG